MAKDKLNNVLSFTDHQANWSPVKAKKTKRTETGLDIINEYADSMMECPDCGAEIQYNEFDTEIECGECGRIFQFDDNGQEHPDMGNIGIKSFIRQSQEAEESGIIEAKEEKETKEKEEKGGIFSKEKELKSNPLFGYAAVRDMEIKKIGEFGSNPFNLKNTDTPKERPSLNAGQFIETEKVSGNINRIDGSKVYIESFDDPLKIVEVDLKDAVKDIKDKDGYLPICKIEDWWELNKKK